jgi:hypothetical protein
MARRIEHLIDEQEDKSKLLRARHMAIERTQEGLKNPSMQESRAPTPEKEELLPSNPLKDPQ